MGNFFDKAYAAYWKQRIGASGDGTKVPDEHVERFFVEKLRLQPRDRVLDLGCGHGRLFPLLHNYSDHVEGVDINEAALTDAAQHPYKKLAVGTAEQTGLESDYFDKVVAWAMYDGVEQERGLVEENRILKNGGLLLITGKNKAYEPNDDKAFIAERNAKLKDFPNHFTDVYGLIRDAALFGFEVVASYGLPRRGDFGELTYIDLLTEQNRKFYEFLLILKKIGTPSVRSRTICYEYSDVAAAQAKENGFADIKSFFLWHKEKYHG